MQRFVVFANTTAVGYSELERGDPPMGTAGGKFISLPAYEAIQASVVAAREASQEHLALSVRTIDGETIPAQGGVQIIDYSSELGADGVEVHVCGIDYPLYEELFPGHQAAYVQAIRKKT
jgi:hypothetical protein